MPDASILALTEQVAAIPAQMLALRIAIGRLHSAEAYQLMRRFRDELRTAEILTRDALATLGNTSPKGTRQ